MNKNCYYYTMCQMCKMCKSGCVESKCNKNCETCGECGKCNCEYYWNGNDTKEKEYMEDIISNRIAKDEE